MAVTKKGFAGKPEEKRAVSTQFSPDDSYGPSTNTDALMKGMVGAAEQNSPSSHGSMAGGETGPRRAGTSQPVPAGNDSSTGAQGPFPLNAAGSAGAQVTGAGQGTRIIKTYGPGSGKGK